MMDSSSSLKDRRRHHSEAPGAVAELSNRILKIVVTIPDIFGCIIEGFIMFRCIVRFSLLIGLLSVATSSASAQLTFNSTTGGTATSISSGSGTVPNTWVKLVRLGNTITASKSSDGATWTLVGNTTVAMATNCYIGLAVTSGSDTTLNSSQFSNLSVTP